MESTNPATGELIARYTEHTDDDVERILEAAVAGTSVWAARTVDERAAVLARLAEVLDERTEQLADLATAEMGKPVAEARAEVAKCATTARYYAEHAGRLLAEQQLDTDEGTAFAQHLPLGVVLGVMPWNYPYWQVVRAAVPIMAAGNGFLLKHAENVSGAALAMAEAFTDAGVPPGAFSVLLLPGDRTSALLDDDRVAAATVTGSERAGTAVAAAAGSNVKPTVLELGGSDAFVVLDDADVPAAAATAVRARFQNTGQSCIAAKRFIVVASVAEEFLTELTRAASRLRTGDPRDDVDLGPLARPDLRDTLADQVRRTVATGGELLTGGVVPDGPGAFYPPTVVRVPDTTVAMMQEETFGPAAAVLVVPDEDAAVEAANATRFGLSSSLWTTDPDRARRVARRLRAGGCFVNAMTASDPRLPFGGVRRSGYGRELAGSGITAFTNLQTVRLVDTAGEPTNPGSDQD